MVRPRAALSRVLTSFRSPALRAIRLPPDEAQERSLARRRFLREEAHAMSDPKMPQTPSEEERRPPKEVDDESLPENSKEHLDEKLDHAIDETFPTSDPISVKITK
jgi:hypothetical protein